MWTCFRVTYITKTATSTDMFTLQTFMRGPSDSMHIECHTHAPKLVTSAIEQEVEPWGSEEIRCIGCGMAVSSWNTRVLKRPLGTRRSCLLDRELARTAAASCSISQHGCAVALRRRRNWRLHGLRSSRPSFANLCNQNMRKHHRIAALHHGFRQSRGMFVFIMSK